MRNSSLAYVRILLGSRDTSPLKSSQLQSSEGHDLVLSISAHTDGLRILKNGAFLSWRSGIPAPSCSNYNTYWESKGQMWVFGLPTLLFPIPPPKAPITGIQGNVSLNPIRQRRKLKSTTLSASFQAVILITAHLEEAPQFLLRKVVQSLSCWSVPEAVPSASALELQGAAVQTLQLEMALNGIHDCTGLHWRVHQFLQEHGRA